jgi:hypothetical protein
MATWGAYEADRIKDIYDYFTRHFSYGRKEIASFKNVVKNRESHLGLLTKAETKLNAKKEKLWSTGDTSKWGLEVPSIDTSTEKSLALSQILPKDTKVVESVKLLYGYYNNLTW